MKKKDYARALADLDQSIDAQPTISGYVVRRSTAPRRREDAALAMADYRQARDLKVGGTLEASAQAIAKSRLGPICAPQVLRACR